MLETGFFSFTYIVFRPVRDKSRRVSLTANELILYLSKKMFCSKVLHYSMRPNALFVTNVE